MGIHDLPAWSGGHSSVLTQSFSGAQQNAAVGRVVRFFSESLSGILFPSHVNEVWFRLQACGAGGGSTSGTTQGASGASSGECIIGRFVPVVGQFYTFTQGAIGTASLSSDGTDATASYFFGLGVEAEALGGVKGKLNGTTSGVPSGSVDATGTYVSYHRVASRAGGLGGNSANGTAGIGIESIIPGGLFGLLGSGAGGGGGGGSSICGRGAKGGLGGNNVGAALTVPTQYSGAGGAGAGADSGGASQLGSPGAFGHLILAYVQ